MKHDKHKFILSDVGKLESIDLLDTKLGNTMAEFASKIAFETDNTITGYISETMPEYIEDEGLVYRYKFNMQKIAKAIERDYKYRWHDLRKNPEDLPEYGKRILFQIDITKIKDGSYDAIEESEEQNVYSGSYEQYLDYFCNDDYEGYATQHSYEVDCVIAWKYIDIYEVEE